MSGYRTRFSPTGGQQVSTGAHPSELWGTAPRDMSKPRRHRGDKARARRRAKRAAKRGNVPLKAYLRTQEKAVSR
jgi:hypothetical protein